MGHSDACPPSTKVLRLDTPTLMKSQRFPRRKLLRWCCPRPLLKHEPQVKPERARNLRRITCLLLPCARSMSKKTRPSKLSSVRRRGGSKLEKIKREIRRKAEKRAKEKKAKAREREKKVKAHARERKAKVHARERKAKETRAKERKNKEHTSKEKRAKE